VAAGDVAVEPALSGEGTVTYAAKTPGLSFEHAELTGGGQYKVALHSPLPEELVLEITTSCGTDEEALTTSLAVASEVLDDLSLAVRQRISGPWRIGFCLKKVAVLGCESEQYAVQTSLTTAWKVKSLLVMYTSSKTLSLLGGLSSADTAHKVHRHLYRAALDIEESLARFMLLYGILLLVCGDSQKKVDNCICRLRPEIPRPKNRSGNRETIYSKLRNDLGHGRPDWSVERLVQEVNTLLPDFVTIVAETVG
jgi:hypothetical protein